MSTVFIAIDPSPIQSASDPGSSSTLDLMLSALKEAITANSSNQVHVIPTDVDLKAKWSEGDVLCPLTLDIPDDWHFPGEKIYSLCRDRQALQQYVQQLGYAVGDGQFWLPIVWTAKGPLYAEAIATEGETYYQPLHLSDRWRQPLYHFGFHLLKSLAAPPATYLIQFSFQGETVIFDRLLPFPAEPAIASLNIQTPNLFSCHWKCLREEAIVDLTIRPPERWSIYEGVGD